ncbi:uncharacterized protein LOC128221327 [Mya arenaria]|uniref:uncharacterized protein LOC128221327 n=1 Tax=Mya arenaria TaxID=6604 RepID=UPI0022E58D19|nr:uncharacterized protein LOC128221327 [Mya arenaria]
MDYMRTKPKTPTKVRARREAFSPDEIPTRDSPNKHHSRRQSNTQVNKRNILSRARDTERLRRHVRSKSEDLSGRRQNGATSRRRLRFSSADRLPGREAFVKCERNTNARNNSATYSDISLSPTERPNALSKNIYNLWRLGRLCDVIIRTKDDTLYAHKLILAANCERKSELIDCDQATSEINIPNVQGNTVNEALAFFYTSILNVSSENIEELLEISNYLGARKLREKCILYLANISLNNAIEHRAIATKYGLSDLVDEIDRYVHDNFTTIVSTDNFLASDFSRVYGIISSDILTVPNELEIFHACAKWLDFDRMERIRYAVSLMGLIRFNCIAPQDIVTDIEPVRFVFDIPECKDFLYNAFRHHALCRDISSTVNMASRRQSSVNLSRDQPDLAHVQSRVPSEVPSHRPSRVLGNAPSRAPSYNPSLALQPGIVTKPDSFSSESSETESISKSESQESKTAEKVNNFELGQKSSAVYHDVADDVLSKSSREIRPHQHVLSKHSRQSASRITSDRDIDKLANKLSGVSMVSKKKFSRADLAKISDFFDGGEKSSSGTSSKSSINRENVNTVEKRPSNVSVQKSASKRTHSREDILSAQHDRASSRASFEGIDRKVSQTSIMPVSAGSWSNKSQQSHLEHNRLESATNHGPWDNEPLRSNVSGEIMPCEIRGRQSSSAPDIHHTLSSARFPRKSIPDHSDSVKSFKANSSPCMSNASVINDKHFRQHSSTFQRKSSPFTQQQNTSNTQWRTVSKRLEQIYELSPIRSESSRTSSKTAIPWPPPPPPLPVKSLSLRIVIVDGSSPYTHDEDSGGFTAGAVHEFDAERNCWVSKTQLPISLEYAATASMGGNLYIIGGQRSNVDNPTSVKDCHCYDYQTNCWHRVGPLKTARIRHAAVPLNDEVYVIGGEDCVQMSMKTVEVYCPENDTWASVTSMTDARVNPAAVAHRGRIFVGGGVLDTDERFLLDTLEVYDPKTGSWSFRYPLPVAVAGAAFVEVDGVIYMVGGYVMKDGEPLSVDSIFRYCDETDTWEPFATLHVPRHCTVAAALNDRIYIIGGESSVTLGSAITNVECVDVKTGSHVTEIAPLPVPSFGIAGCLIGNE